MKLRAGARQEQALRSLRNAPRAGLGAALQLAELSIETGAVPSPVSRLGAAMSGGESVPRVLEVQKFVGARDAEVV